MNCSIDIPITVVKVKVLLFYFLIDTDFNFSQRVKDYFVEFLCLQILGCIVWTALF